MEFVAIITKTVIALATFVQALRSLTITFVEAKKLISQNIEDVDKKPLWSQFMKSKRIKYISLLFVVSFAFSAWAYSDNANPLTKSRRVGIPPFVNKTEYKWMIDQEIGGELKPFDKYSWNAAETLSAILSDIPDEHHNYVIVDQQEIDDSLDQIKRSGSVFYDEKTQLELGRLLAANTFVKGTITRISVPNMPSIDMSSYQQKKVEVTISITVKQVQDGIVVHKHEYNGKDVDICKKKENCKTDQNMILNAIKNALGKIAKDKKFVASLTK